MLKKIVVNCNLKCVYKLHMNSTISYYSKGCSPSNKVTIRLSTKSYMIRISLTKIILYLSKVKKMIDKW